MARPPWRAGAAALLAALLGAAPRAAGGSFVQTAEQRTARCCGPGGCVGAPAVEQNNLGGVGPDAGRLGILYTRMPAGCGPSGDPSEVDLLVSTRGDYRTRYPGRNGLYGELMRVNVQAGTTAHLELELRDALGAPVQAKEAVLHVFNLDQGHDQTSRSGVGTHGFTGIFTGRISKLRKILMQNGHAWFVSTAQGAQADAPSDLKSLTRAQLDKAVSFRYADVSAINVTFRVTSGDADHDFVFGLKVCTGCSAAASWHAGHLPEGADASGLSSPERNSDQPWQVASSRACKGQEVEWAGCSGLPDCNHCIPQDCAFSDWGEWYDAGGCTGLCFRHREEVQPNNECGKPCDGLIMDTKRCEKAECLPKVKRDGELSEWGMWSACQGRQRERAREVKVYPRNGGRAAEGPLNQMRPCSQQAPPDCLLAQWGVWTSCSASCGVGWHNRVRRIVQFSQDGGRPCAGSLREMRPCDMGNCKGLPCIFGPWSSWEGCDNDSPEQKFRSRVVKQEASGDGAPCRGLVRETMACHLPRPTDCTLSAWDSWSACDRTCDGGQAFRKRKVTAPPSHGGSCPEHSLREAVPCNTQLCFKRLDCEVADWNDWTACSDRCAGIHKRDRRIVRHANSIGQGCHYPLEEVRSCQRAGATCQGPTDCQWGDWSSWSACTCTCGGGTKRRNRHILVAPTDGGQLCDVEDKSQVFPCNTEACDERCVDGRWGPWSTWSECSTTCGSGFVWRHRDVVQQANLCGKPAVGKGQDWKLCKASWDSEGVGDIACGNRDCLLSSWNSWSSCTCTCWGVRERQRVVAQFHAGSGRPCISQPLMEVVPCNPGMNQQPLPDCVSQRQDCILGQWSEWSPCPVSCGGGNRERTRHILTPAFHGGRPCSDVLAETTPCSVAPCALDNCLDCRWAPWSEWGTCSKCGDQRYRHRRIEQLANSCGRKCEPGNAKEVSNCTSHCHTRFYCSLREWSAWSGCSADCGTATRMRQRSLRLSRDPEAEVLFELNHDTRGSAICSGTQMDSEPCKLRSCDLGCLPQACEFQPWSEWEEPTCIGLCERSRSISRMNNECGPPCNGSLVQTKRCTRECTKIRDCRFSAWHPWSQPDQEGRAGQVYRTRSVIQVPTNGGKPCYGALQETVSVEPEGKRHPCRPGEWGEWSACSRTCGGGWAQRLRSLARAAGPGALPCEASLVQGRNCSVQPCGYADCQLGEWGPWSNCQPTGGQQFRRREIERQPAGGGKSCGTAGAGADSVPLGETRQCGISRTDCVVSHWSPWDDCDKTCGGGEQQRHRQVEVYPSNGGLSCPVNLREMRGCNALPCNEQDCRMGPWAAWGECSSSCGAGQQLRNREVAQRPLGGGKACQGDTSETRQCLTAAGSQMPSCGLIDCQWGEWSDWSACTCTCSGGQRNRIRHIARVPRDGGAMCLPVPKEELQPCNTQPCHSVECIDGRWGAWEAWSPCTNTCGGGSMWRHRNLEQEATECGEPASGLSRDIRPCNEHVSCEADIDCQWSTWSDWSGCTASCDGVKRRSRRVEVSGRANGAWCLGAARETSPCNPSPGESVPYGCQAGEPLNCMLGVWSEWSGCEVTCGGGQVRRERSVEQEARHGGHPCGGSLSETRECGVLGCPAHHQKLDCRWGDWSDWGACSKCGGQRSRFRHIMAEPRYGGEPCDPGAAEEMGKCPRECADPLYCVWDHWGPFGPCSETCGSNAKKSRRRQLIMRTAAEVQALGLLYEEPGRVGDRVQATGAKFLPQGLRMEILAALACGYLAHSVVLMASRGCPHRRQPARVAAVPAALAERHNPQVAASSSGARSSGWRAAWPGGCGGLLASLFSAGAAARMGYRPVSQAPLVGEIEA